MIFYFQIFSCIFHKENTHKRGDTIKQQGESVDPTQDSHEELCNDICPMSKSVLRVRALPRPGLLQSLPTYQGCYVGW